MRGPAALLRSVGGQASIRYFWLTRRNMESRKGSGPRKFYQLPDDLGSHPEPLPDPGRVSELFGYVDENVVGRNLTFAGPYGRRKVIYCDYTASARSLGFIEDYIQNDVLPYYGNTHTTTTVTSMQSTLFRQEARDIIRNAVNASEKDLLVFSGHGCTGAVHKLIHGLDLPSLPVVFVGPSEHHSNLLPWRELGSKIVRISETKEGILDLVDLENQLQIHRQEDPNMLLIGCFSGASNITGILADDIATTLLLHQYGALAFWDYATAAPYVKLDMNPLIPGIDGKAAYKDAMFFSVHKFIGGVQTPGILVAKKSLFKNPVPQGCGGGTVFFVSRTDHRYLKDIEMREEGGTAAIVESIRAGLVFQLKQSIGTQAIMGREEVITKMVLSHIRTIPEILLLGSSSLAVKRLAVFSFMVRHPRGTFLHHNFVCAVLNDMFGIQARGGCACAGPYALDLMGIDEELATKYENVLLEDSRLDRHHLRRHEEHSNYEMLRPGFTRISLPFFMPDAEIAFVLEALKMVATEGWKLLPQYMLHPETGEWRHHSNLVFRERKWLGAVNYAGGKMSVNERRTSGINPCPKDYADCLYIARNTFNKARKMAQRYPLADQCAMFDGDLNELRWFMLPSEAQDLLLGHSANVKQEVPFQPIANNGTRPPPIPLVARHNSLSALDTKCLPIRSELKLPRHRSDSQSPTRSRHSPLPSQHLRERCYSLGSELIPKPPSPAAEHLFKRHRLVSCGSQTDIADSDTSFGDIENNRTNSPMLVTTNSPEHLHAYMQGVTKELATEIKFELREVIAQVEDVLSESIEGDHSTLVKTQERGSIDPNATEGFYSPMMSVVCNNIPIINQPPQEISIISPYMMPNLYVTQISEAAQPQDTISADKFSEYLAELTTEMVSEMKSEFREMVSAVDELISPNGDLQKNFTENSNQSFSNAKNQNGIECISSQKNRKTEDVNDNGDTSATKHECCIRARNGNSQGKCLKKENMKQISAKPCWHCPPKNIWKPAYEAVNEFNMIQDGDRILVCLSGGKDSLSLLQTLRQYQHYATSKGIHFDLAAATVDPGSSAYDPRPLKPYLKTLGVEYFYEEQSILSQATEANCKSICSFCSRMKRGRLYATARRHGYNVLALGQHLDDLAESFLMSTFHNGRLRSMKANYYVREGDLRVIRPFVYVRERSLRQFAESRNLPIIPENCPACFHAPKERHRMKQLLAQQEILFPKLFLSLRTAIKPLISVNHTGQENNRTLSEMLGSRDSFDGFDL